MKVEACVWYDSGEPRVWHEVKDYASAGSLMTDFMTNGWYKMEFYCDGKRSHTVLATEDECDPVIVEYREDYLMITPVDGS